MPVDECLAFLSSGGLRQAELMTSAPLCSASKIQGIVLIAKKTSFCRVPPLHIYVSLILKMLQDYRLFKTLFVKLS